MFRIKVVPIRRGNILPYTICLQHSLLMRSQGHHHFYKWHSTFSFDKLIKHKGKGKVVPVLN
jgi:hypothetical protein